MNSIIIIQHPSKELMFIPDAVAQEARQLFKTARKTIVSVKRLQIAKLAAETTGKAARLRGEAVEHQLIDIREAKRLIELRTNSYEA